MKKYIGVKLVNGSAMTLGEYNKYRGWVIPADENPDAAGYLVEYLDGGKANHPGHGGYISWSPAFAFEGAYRETTGLTFGLATEAAKRGLKVARIGWNGSGMFAYIVPPGKYPAKTAVAKEHFGDELVPYRAYWALKTAQGDVSTWAPSGSDSLADDWVIL